MQQTIIYNSMTQLRTNLVPYINNFFFTQEKTVGKILTVRNFLYKQFINTTHVFLFKMVYFGFPSVDGN